jgi:hypothetical protein
MIEELSVQFRIQECCVALSVSPVAGSRAVCTSRGHGRAAEENPVPHRAHAHGGRLDVYPPLIIFPTTEKPLL